MEQFREVKNALTWHKTEGTFDVEIINGVITKLNFCEMGISSVDNNKSLTSTNLKFLKAVYESLGDVFTFIEEENKKLGYKFADEFEEPQLAESEILTKQYNTQEEKL